MPQYRYQPQHNQCDQVHQPQQHGGNGHQEWADMIAEVMREQFGLKPKNSGIMYRQPYLESFDRVPQPNRYKITEFSKFLGQDNISTIENINRFLAQCGKASAMEALRVRFFPLLLSESAFTWFFLLPPNSIRGWVDLEKQFHKYFFAGVQEMKLSNLTSIRQRSDESVPDYIQRFRDIRRYKEHML